ncbi:hypothetical protein Hanom_Chr04g00334081 [Helianthus anomalus]
MPVGPEIEQERQQNNHHNYRHRRPPPRVVVGTSNLAPVSLSISLSILPPTTTGSKHGPPVRDIDRRFSLTLRLSA